MTPAVRRAYEWLVLAHVFSATVCYFSTKPEPSWASAETMMRVAHQGAVFVDIRSEFLHSGLGIPGSTNIPTADIEFRADELPRGVPVVVFGGIGDDSAAAYAYLRGQGFDVYDLGPYTRMPHEIQHHMHPAGGGGAGHTPTRP